MKKWQHILLVILFSIGISIPVILPYFNAGYFPTHDGEWAVVRAAEMFREIRDLQLPPRFSGALNFGFGYPLFNFAYPGPYYITTAIHASGLDFTESVKILFILTVPFSFLGMYVLSRELFKKTTAGLLSAVLYIYLPYRMVDLYARGNIGESIAFALFPWIFWCLYSIATRKEKWSFMFLLTPLVFLLIISHNIMSVYFGILFLVFLIACLISHKLKEALIALLGVVWGGLLSFYFLVPALFEKQYIKLSEIPIADRNLYFVSIEKLFFSKWGHGTPTEPNPFPYLLGLPQVIGVLLSVSILRKKPSFDKTLSISFLILLILLILMMFPFMPFVWQLPLLFEINYPWTLLLPIGFLMCLLTGYVVHIKKGILIGTVLCIVPIVLYLPFANPSGYVNYGDAHYITNEATTTSSDELMPLWVKEKPMIRFSEKVVVENPEVGYVTGVLYDSNKISFTTDLKQPGAVTVNTIYYPGWRAYVNESEVEISYGNTKGLMEIGVPAGTSRVVLRFAETPLRFAADIVSSVALLSFLGALFAHIALQLDKKRKEKRKAPKSSKSS